MKVKWFGRVLLLAGLLCLVTGTVTAQQYTLIRFAFNGMVAPPLYGMNNRGDVVAYDELTNAPVRYTDGTLYFFGRPNTAGSAINNLGQVVINTPSDHASITTQPPSLASYYLDLGSLYYGGHSRGYAINDSGTIVGFSGNSNLTMYHAFAYFFSLSYMSDLGTLGTTSMARAINNSSQIVGESLSLAGYRRAFRMVNGTMTDLDPANPAYDSYATGINDAGQIVVVTNKAWHLVRVSAEKLRWVAYRGSVWYTLVYNGGVLTDLGNLGVAAGTFGASINAGGDVVGMTNVAGQQRAFLYHAGYMKDLNSYDITNLAGWQLLIANNINDSGQIVCLGLNPAGQYETVLLTPTGPPV